MKAEAQGADEDVFDSPRGDVYTRGEIDSALDELRQSNTAAIATALSNLNSSLASNQQKAIQKLDNNIEAQYNMLHSQISGVDTRTTKLQEDNQRMWQEIKMLKEGLAHAEAIPPEVSTIAPQDWKRPPNHSQIIVRFRDIYGLAKLQEQADILAGYLKCSKDHFAIDGPKVGRRFYMQFKGAPQLAADRARAALGALYNIDDKTWTAVKLAGPDDRQVEPMLFAGVGPRAAALGATARKTAKAVRELLPQAEVWVQKKKDFVVYANLLPLGRVFSDSPNHTEVKYQAATLATLGVTKDAINAKVEQSSAAFLTGEELWEL